MVRTNTLGFQYRDEATPCADINYGDRWGLTLRGYLTVVSDGSDAAGVVVYVGASVNDGIRLTIGSPTGAGTDLCRIDMWHDVDDSAGANWHDTDGHPDDNGELEEYGCEDVFVTFGALYPLTVEFYHQPETVYSSGLMHNYALLEVWLSGLGAAGHVEFYRDGTI